MAHPADSFLDQLWAGSIVPTLHDYIAIPALSPAFAPTWEADGHIERAIALIAEWCRARPIDGMTLEVHRIAGRTPLILIDIPAWSGSGAAPADDDTVVLYGHLDKQPEMEGWRPGLGPWQPVMEGDRLYGRGGADDGYAVFASLAAIEAVRETGGAHARCVVLIEASEESGSCDLPVHIAALAPRLGAVGLVICLDSGCADYERLWVTTSLRGLLGGRLDVEILHEGVHSGDASGIVPSSFRIARALLDRIEDAATGEILVAACHGDIPAARRADAAATAAAIAGAPAEAMPFVDGARPVTADPVEQLLNRTWRPMLEIVGADGLPATEVAGNVLRPHTALRLSMRLPPGVAAAAAQEAVVQALTHDPPYGARVTFDADHVADGWNAPEFAPWLSASLDAASHDAFGAPACAFGEGGSIPFMHMLGERFPAAQFVICGVLGPGSNAHGPNEFLHVPTARRLTTVIARVLHDHTRR